MGKGGQKKYGGFSDLGPDRVLHLVERGLGRECTNLFRPMNSYINRVFEVETRTGERLIAKFYRPGRWTAAAIGDEHRFLLDLSSAEVPVVAPLPLASGKTLGESEGLLFAVFPKCGGRSSDEFDEEGWLQLGRLLGRAHAIGARNKAVHRQVIGPGHSTREQLAYLSSCPIVPDDLKPRLAGTVESILKAITPLFAGVKNLRIHGDCHFSNIINRPDEGFYLIDFDDMAMGPAVQDLWLLLPGTAGEAAYELELLLEGYETFHPFDRRSLVLIEPLRAMRYIHYMAWCARQVEADGLTRAIDGFGDWHYWSREIGDLLDQQQRIAETPPPSGNFL
jgi:Ser/Thr protein kinase RdoA (MazF antagonist)